MKTSGRVQGSMIMDKPATYAMINQERYVVEPWLSTAKSLVIEKTIPTKISEIKTKEITANDFFASTCDDIKHLYASLILNK